MRALANAPLGTAIVLAWMLTIVVVCVLLIRLARKRWAQHRRRKPRRRDFTPVYYQRLRLLKAKLRRVQRGLRFPTVEQKKDHIRFKKQLVKAAQQDAKAQAAAQRVA